MQPEPAIAVHGLGKSFAAITGGPRYRTLRDDLGSLFARRTAGERRWAVRDLSFSIAQGEVVGIIGRNGAGKSTLMRLLSRVIEPTAGEARLRGRIGSLLEVGTGFHPELSARDNILLAGAVMGMTAQEVSRHFDAIVAFAEVGDSLDLPIKHFSSGMQVRLGFAVAAFLEADILLLDEVLSVGDAAFQRRCAERVSDRVAQGRTALVVSHNLATIRSLCSRTLWIDGGRLAADGPSDEVVKAYLASIPEQGGQDGSAILAHHDTAISIHAARFLQDGRATTAPGNGAPFILEIDAEVHLETPGLRVYVDLLDDFDQVLFRAFHDGDEDRPVTLPVGRWRARMTIPADLLAPRRYACAVHATIWNVRQCTPQHGLRCTLHPVATSGYNRSYPGDPVRGLLAPRIAWTIAGP
jgi:lipopolysaccharide transport system ATP-binding protein